MRDRMWQILGKLFDLAGMFAVLFLIMALSFAIGHHVGFKGGLETKITVVGEQYTMKLKKGVK